MSHSPTRERQGNVNDYNAGWVAVHALLREGASWSGRERNCCFLNTGELPFVDVSAVSGLDFADDGRALAVVDWDRDGALDLWTSARTSPRVRFLRNRAKTNHHFLAVRLEGTQCNRDAIGARLELSLPGRKLNKTLSAGDAFLAQSSKWLHFGLGEATAIESLLVRWPDGSQEAISDLSVDGFYQIRQGSGLAERVEQSPPNLTSSPLEALPVSEEARIALATKVPLPPISYLDPSGNTVPFRVAPKKAILINLWSSTCAPCLEELRDFSTHAAELSAAGLDVLALNVDSLPQREQASAMLTRLDWPFASGVAPRELSDVLDVLQRGLLERHRPLPLPSSFLVDGKGNLAVIYKGAIDSGRLLEDVSLLEAPAPQMRDAAAHFAGTWSAESWGSRIFPLARQYLDNGFTDVASYYFARLTPREEVSDSSSRSQKMLIRAYLRLGVALEAEQRFEQSIAVFQRAIELDPNAAAPHHYLGISLSRRGRQREAIQQLEEALRLDPNKAAVHFVLGVNHESLGNREEAIRHYREALRLQPTHQGARSRLDSVLSKKP